MARVRYVFRPEDHPDFAETEVREALNALWAHLFPDGQPGEPHAGYAVLAQSPRLALGIAKLADCVLEEIGWTQRRDLPAGKPGRSQQRARRPPFAAPWLRPAVRRLADITGTPAMPRTVALQATFRY